MHYLNRGKQAGGLTYKAKEPKFRVSAKALPAEKKPYGKSLKTKNVLTELKKHRRQKS